MSPRFLAKRDDCDVTTSNDCRSGIKPTTYATSITLIILFVLFFSCFVMRRRRRQRFNAIHSQPITIAPLSTLPPPHNPYNPPPPIFFEPAPPYDPTKVPPPPPEQPNPPPAMPQPAVVPVQYPPPSYSPA